MSAMPDIAKKQVKEVRCRGRIKDTNEVCGVRLCRIEGGIYVFEHKGVEIEFEPKRGQALKCRNCGYKTNLSRIK